MNQKKTTAEDVVAYIKENYPETEQMFQEELNKWGMGDPLMKNLPFHERIQI